MFDEVYPEVVRVIKIGQGDNGLMCPMELCGGTHLNKTGLISVF